ncbi:MAG: YdcH family protein [Pseudomonadota bacterium]
MTQSPQMQRNEVLLLKLALLREQHRDLDEAIHALHDRGTADMLTMQRLKRQKLALKDQIARLEDEITPDIIA